MEFWNATLNTNFLISDTSVEPIVDIGEGNPFKKSM
jgi:hypothetical protein